MTQASNEGATGIGPKQARKADCFDSAAFDGYVMPHIQRQVATTIVVTKKHNADVRITPMDCLAASEYTRWVKSKRTYLSHVKCKHALALIDLCCLR